MSDKGNGATALKAFYDAPRVLVLYADALPLVEVTAIAAIASKHDIPLELGSRSRFAMAAIAPTTPRAVHTLLVEAASAGESSTSVGDIGNAIAISGALSDIRQAIASISSAVTPVVAILDVDERGSVEGGGIETAIAMLDERAETRPWHYIVRVRTIPSATDALAALFRAAPSLAHRVTGVVIAAGVPLSEEVGRELLECAGTFGLTFLGAGVYDRAFYEAIAAN